jgi:hypothetical protein
MAQRRLSLPAPRTPPSARLKRRHQIPWAASRRDNRSRRGPEVIAAATEAPRGERSHAVGAHVAERHGRVGRRIWHGRTIAEDETRRFPRRVLPCRRAPVADSPSRDLMR